IRRLCRPSPQWLLPASSRVIFSLLSLIPTPRPPRPTLSPYTTLFRSATGSRNGDTNRHASMNRATHNTAMTMMPNRMTCSTSGRSEEHTSELQSRFDLVCRLLLEKKKSHAVYAYGIVTNEKNVQLVAA